MAELERQALERYKTLKEQNIEREQQAFEVFLKASKAKTSLDSQAQATPSSQSSQPQDASKNQEQVSIKSKKGSRIQR